LRHPVLEELFKKPCTGEIIQDTLYWENSLRNPLMEIFLRHPVLEELFKTPCTGEII